MTADEMKKVAHQAVFDLIDRNQDTLLWFAKEYLPELVRIEDVMNLLGFISDIKYSHRDQGKGYALQSKSD